MMPTNFGNNYMIARGPNLINRLFMGFKKFNWSNFLSGANKTLNIVNQTIPIIKETRPIINNVRSIVNLTKAFGKETSSKDNKVKEVKNTFVKDDASNTVPTFFA